MGVSNLHLQRSWEALEKKKVVKRTKRLVGP